jgi:hypothetical protein
MPISRWEALEHMTRVGDGPARSAYMEWSIELFAAVNFLVTGLSHLLQPKAWVDFFVWLRGRGYPGVFVNGFLSLGFGSLVVSFHNVWTGLPMVLTIVGWLHVVKALISFSAPRIGMRSLERVAPERGGEFVGAGVMLLALSALMWYLVLVG